MNQPTGKTILFNVIDELQSHPLDEIKQIAAEASLPFAVAIANITGDLNTGAIIRSAACFGATKVFIFGRRKYDRRSTVGAHHYLDIESYPNVPDEKSPFSWVNLIQLVRVNGWTPVLIEQGGPAIISGLSTMWPPPCFVFGDEDSGIPEEICKTELRYSINHPGVVRSLNVSVAAGIVMHHMSLEVGAKYNKENIS